MKIETDIFKTILDLTEKGTRCCVMLRRDPAIVAGAVLDLEEWDPEREHVMVSGVRRETHEKGYTGRRLERLVLSAIVYGSWIQVILTKIAVPMDSDNMGPIENKRNTQANERPKLNANSEFGYASYCEQALADELNAEPPQNLHDLALIEIRKCKERIKFLESWKSAMLQAEDPASIMVLGNEIGVPMNGNPAKAMLNWAKDAKSRIKHLEATVDGLNSTLRNLLPIK